MTKKNSKNPIKPLKNTNRKASKVDLSKEASAGPKAEVDSPITDEQLLDICPKHLLSLFKKAKTPAARADLLFELSNNEWKELKKAFEAVDNFLGKLEQWFIQEFQDDQRGVTGKVGRVEIKTKELATVEDWTKFYKHIAKKNEFDLLNKAVNQKAVKERWEQGKEVPGTDKFIKRVVSLTQAKGTK